MLVLQVDDHHRLSWDELLIANYHWCHLFRQQIVLRNHFSYRRVASVRTSEGIPPSLTALMQYSSSYVANQAHALTEEGQALMQYSSSSVANQAHPLTAIPPEPKLDLSR
jgi:hypothetical protein